MKVKVNELEDNKAELVVTLDSSYVSEKILKKYRETARKYTIPGFRPGKAPRKIIDNYLGREYVRALSTDELVNETVDKAIDQSRINPLGEPDFGSDDIKLANLNEDYEYAFTIKTLPIVALTSYDTLKFEAPSPEVSEAVIQDEIDAILNHYSENVPAPANTKIQKDRMASLTINAKDEDGNAIEALCEEEMTYSVGSNLYSEEFDAALIGLKKSESCEVDIDEIPEESHLRALCGEDCKKVHFEVTVVTVLKKKAPKLTDEWVKDHLGVETVDEFKKELSDELEQQTKNYAEKSKEEHLTRELQKRFEGEVPDEVLNDAIQNLSKDFFMQLQMQGLTLDSYLAQMNIDIDQFREDLRQQAQDVSRQYMALDSFAKERGVEITDEEVKENFKDSGVADPDQVYKDWENNGTLHKVRLAALRSKMLHMLLEEADVTYVPFDPAAEK